MIHPLPILLVNEENQEYWERLLSARNFAPLLLDGRQGPESDDESVLAQLQEWRTPGPAPSLDSQTGLPIRRQALADLEDEATLEESDPLWVAVANIDHFKAVNDRFGHSEADRILGQVGNTLQATVPEARVVGRLGGDTVLLALRGDRDQVRRAVSRYLSATRSIEWGRDLHVTLSAGLARHRPGEPVRVLIDRADGCLYEAKTRGRDQLVDELDFAERSGGTDLDVELADFENRVKVFADRLVAGLTGRGRKMIETYRDEADHDGLTGLYNRRYLDRRLDREVQRSRQLGSPLSIVLLDLDDFGNVNRTYGYPAGDEALKAAARVVLKGIRVVDWAGRYGGEELCAVFPDTSLDVAVTIAERIRQALTDLKLVGVDGHPFSISGSLGVVTLEDADLTVPHLIQRVGMAVRDSKAAGKNRVTATSAI